MTKKEKKNKQKAQKQRQKQKQSTNISIHIDNSKKAGKSKTATKSSASSEGKSNSSSEGKSVYITSTPSTQNYPIFQPYNPPPLGEMTHKKIIELERKMEEAEEEARKRKKEEEYESDKKPVPEEEEDKQLKKLRLTKERDDLIETIRFEYQQVGGKADIDYIIKMETTGKTLERQVKALKILRNKIALGQL